MFPTPKHRLQEFANDMDRKESKSCRRSSYTAAVSLDLIARNKKSYSYLADGGAYIVCNWLQTRDQRQLLQGYNIGGLAVLAVAYFAMNRISYTVWWLNSPRPFQSQTMTAGPGGPAPTKLLSDQRSVSLLHIIECSALIPSFAI